MWVTLSVAIVRLLVAWINRKGGKDQLEDALAKEEIHEDILEKRIIKKSDDVINWFKRWQMQNDPKKRQKYIHYLINKVKEYDALRSRLGTS